MDNEEAIKILINAGLLIPFDDNLKLYHGRAAKISETWKVNPTFSNSSNKTGNHNVFAVSALSTADRTIAEEFAKARSYRELLPQVYRIKSYKQNSLIFNCKVNPSIFSKEEVIDALKSISLFSKCVPPKFEDREKFRDALILIREYRAKKNIGYFSFKDLDSFYLEKHINNEQVKLMFDGIAGAENSRICIMNNPKYILRKFIFEKDENKRKSIDFNFNGHSLEGPSSMEYIASLLSELNIVGIKSGVSSATLDKDIDAVFLFDEESVNTEKIVGDKLRSIMNMYGPITKKIKIISHLSDEQLKALSGTPENIIKYIKAIPGFKNILDSSSGVWEGFTVGQHMQTVLTIFQKSFSQDVPNDLIPFINLVIVSHDIGKGEARKRGANTNDYTRMVAKDLFQKMYLMRLSPQYYDLAISGTWQNPLELMQLNQYYNFVMGIVNDSQKITTDYYVHHNDSALSNLNRCSQNLLRNFADQEPSNAEIEGLSNICRILQTCDSGAYTRYALTQDKNGGYFKNANDAFTKNFSSFGLVGDKIRFKNDIVNNEPIL